MRFGRKAKIASPPRSVVRRLTTAMRGKMHRVRQMRSGLPAPLHNGPPEALVGLGRFMANPRRFGGLVSGPVLAAAITRGIAPGTGPVLELGPGTGVFTRALLARGVAEHDLVLVEADPLLAARLRSAFPKSLVLTCRAADINAELLEGRRPSAVVSGLPLLNFPGHEVERIITATFALCTADTVIHQFTYGPRCPVREDIMARLGLSAERTSRVWRNVPPASVYRITRRTAADFTSA